MRAKSPTRLRAAELCQQFPDTPNRTLARRLATECKAITVEQARNYIREVRGVHGKKSAKTAETPKAPGKAGQVYEMPKSKAESWDRYEVAGKSVAILSDIHVPYHDEVALAAAVKYCKDRNPDTLLLNGDFADFYSISRWDKNPKNRDLTAELEAQKACLRWLRQEFHFAEIILKKGNHEERWDHWLWKHAPEISDHPRMKLEEWLGCNDLGIEIVEDQRPIMLGKLPVLHGHELGKSIFSPVNPARGAFIRSHHTVLVSHSHQTSGHADTDLFRKETFVWSIGCLCGLSPDYSRINRWNHGFAFVEIQNNGDFNVTNLRISKNGTVHTA